MQEQSTRPPLDVPYELLVELERLAQRVHGIAAEALEIEEELGGVIARLGVGDLDRMPEPEARARFTDAITLFRRLADDVDRT